MSNDANAKHTTASDIRLTAERLDKCLPFDEKDEATIREAVQMLLDFATFVECGATERKRRPRRGRYAPRF